MNDHCPIHELALEEGQCPKCLEQSNI
jgi:hypothetical protein